ncbi:hypothetical protein [Flavobacterium selenitireducens]
MSLKVFGFYEHVNEVSENQQCDNKKCSHGLHFFKDIDGLVADPEHGSRKQK